VSSPDQNRPPRFPGTPPDAWPAARAAARRLISPVERFLAIEAASGILLLGAAVLALAWANSPWQELYRSLWHTPLGLRLGPWAFERDLHFLINDVLMVVFFFVVGLEIRRELHDGELSEPRRAALPAFAALGGMIAPALIYLAFNAGTPAVSGWGVPMATDIAFAVGVLALLGKRCRPAQRVLLLALAVIDDLGAIIVIALFYSSGIQLDGLALAAGGLLLLFVLQKLGVRASWAYVPVGLIVWAGAYRTGVHPTLAGVVLGLLTPVRAWEGHEEQAPVSRLQHLLHPWVAYVIMPIFALANAGVSFGGAVVETLTSPIALGIVAGLIIGKQLGITLFAWLAVRSGVAELPEGISWRHVYGAGWLAGIGFTMSLFITDLAFSEDSLVEDAKVGILGASLIAGVVGWMILRGASRPR
jgi:NhaA family Na+:H+ antiporter